MKLVLFSVGGGEVLFARVPSILLWEHDTLVLLWVSDHT